MILLIAAGVVLGAINLADTIAASIKQSGLSLSGEGGNVSDGGDAIGGASGSPDP